MRLERPRSYDKKKELIFLWDLVLSYFKVRLEENSSNRFKLVKIGNHDQ